jgi:hypothetical protein
VSSRRPTLEAIAYHEAGHAVVGHCDQYHPRIKMVTINPDKNDDTLGRCFNRGFGRRFDPEVTVTPAMRVKMEAVIVTTLAGPEAEKRLRGRYNHRWASSDRQSALNLITYLVGSDEELQAYLNLLHVRAKNAVALYWDLIEKVAQALLFEKEFNGDRLLDVMFPESQV